MKQKIVAIAAIIFWGIACIKGNYSVVIRDSVDEVEEWSGLCEYRKIIEEYGYMLGNGNMFIKTCFISASMKVCCTIQWRI